MTEKIDALYDYLIPQESITLWEGQLLTGTINVDSTKYRFLLLEFDAYCNPIVVDKQHTNIYIATATSGTGDGVSVTKKTITVSDKTIVVTYSGNASNWANLVKVSGIV